MKKLAEKPIYAKKSFGQNFLVDQNYVDKIIAAVDPQSDEIVVEIGPGRGALTEKLLAKGARVAAIELERDMIAALDEKFGGNENYTLYEADALKFEFEKVAEKFGTSFKLVANLPYYISTAILQKLIDRRELFSEFVLMFQREVVERITAAPATSERGYLSVLTQNYCTVEKLFDVPPQAFRPAPKVWSAVVRLTPKMQNENSIDDRIFRDLIAASFRQKRKTILNNLKNAPFLDEGEKAVDLLEKCGINPERRAETLEIDEFRCLANEIARKSENFRVVGGEKVFGAVIDDETRCRHYHGALDIIAIKFKCCARFYPCFACHRESSTHPAQIWKKSEFDEKAILCGGCRETLSIKEYLESNFSCPHCRRDFNPKCADHYKLYFQVND